MIAVAPPQPQNRPTRPERWGVQERYRDAFRESRVAPETTVAAILESMGAAGDDPPAGDSVVFLRSGPALSVDAPAELRTDDGAVLSLAPGDAVPADLPFGYHTLTDQTDGRERTLVRSPGVCRVPDGRAWGWSAQVYAARSAQSWGMGDLADLRRLGRWSAGELGAGLLMLNPLHASLPGLPQTASPYFPSSRRFRNPLFLRVEDVPGSHALGSRLDQWAREGRALNTDRTIDRDSVFRLKMQALEELWSGFGGDAGFDAFCRAEGESLETYATFCVLYEEHGGPWRTWPAQYRHPGQAAVTAFRQSHARRVDFHRWLQWLLDVQLARAAAEVPLVTDLAVGFDPDGADAWQWQDFVAPGMAVGAPADAFNTQGQDWGLPPFDPWRLRAAAYQPFIETLRAGFRHTSGLRLDHVMGLFRLFWVPHGSSPADGAYVRYPAADLLDLVALESYRGGAYLVGEDLGTADDEIRTELSDRHVLSYRLLLFEEIPPEEYPVEALAAVATHDLPTVAGIWDGGDLRALTEAGLPADPATMRTLRARLRDLAGVDDDAPVDEMVAATHAALARAPSSLLAASLDDALAVAERPNVPGTTDQWPNWSLALPVPVEELERSPLPRRIAAVLRRSGTEEG